MATKVKTKHKSSVWVENVKTIVYAGLIAMVVRTVAFKPINIPSGSMIPTMLVGDWLFVNKLVYGPHIPFTHSSLPGYADPNRGDIGQRPDLRIPQSVVAELPGQQDQRRFRRHLSRYARIRRALLTFLLRFYNNISPMRREWAIGI